jgi:hypothetical protein
LSTVNFVAAVVASKRDEIMPTEKLPSASMEPLALDFSYLSKKPDLN